MTGQVKEDILSRFGELGLEVREGQIKFRPELFDPAEFLSASRTFDYYDVRQNRRSLALEAGTLAFTFCQVPVVVHRSDKQEIRLTARDGSEKRVDGLSLSPDISQGLFQRTGGTVRMDVLVRL